MTEFVSCSIMSSLSVTFHFISFHFMKAVSLGLNTHFQTWVVLCGDPFGCPSYSIGDWKGGNLFLVSAQHKSLQHLFCSQHYLYLKAQDPSNLTVNVNTISVEDRQGVSARCTAFRKIQSEVG